MFEVFFRAGRGVCLLAVVLVVPLGALRGAVGAEPRDFTYRNGVPGALLGSLRGQASRKPSILKCDPSPDAVCTYSGGRRTPLPLWHLGKINLFDPGGPFCT